MEVLMPRSLSLAAVAAAAVLLLLPTPVHAASYTRVVSWNLRHEGYSGETDYAGDAAQIWQQYGSSSTSANGCDVVLLQEVMYSTAASGIASALTSLTGVTWSYSCTAAIGRTTYKECYAVVYRTDNISLLSSTVYSDTSDLFEREPQIVKIRDKRTLADFTFINWHCTFGTSAERQAECANIYKVFQSVQNGSTSDQDVILNGDFNQDATASSFSSLTSTANISPQVSYQVNVATSLNSSGGYVSAYDHFWDQVAYLTEYSSSGRDYVANTLSFYNGLSDHAPVWLKLYSSADDD
jgi:endonuclease/exonuclease/phosphatase family metal-dependent hydrolase